MANAGTLTVTLQAVSQKFTAGMNKAAGSLKMFRGAIGPVQAALGGLSAGLLAARFTKVAGDLDMLADSAQSLGVSIKDLSSLQYAGVVKGIANDQLSGALDRLNRATVLASDGNARYAKSFDQLGLNSKDFLKLDAEKKLFAFADALQGIDDPARRSAIAIRLLGNNSADMMDLLSGGAAGLRTLQKEADSIGASINTSAETISKFNEQLARLGALRKAGEMQIVIAFAPTAEKLLGDLVGFVAANPKVDANNITGPSGRTDSGGGWGPLSPVYRMWSGIFNDDNAGLNWDRALKVQAAERLAKANPKLADNAFRFLGNDARGSQLKEMGVELAKGIFGPSIRNIQQMAPSGASGMQSLFGNLWAAYSARMSMQPTSKSATRAMAPTQVGENNILQRGTREEWIARHSQDKQQEQIDILKAIKDGINEIPRKAMMVATIG